MNESNVVPSIETKEDVIREHTYFYLAHMCIENLNAFSGILYPVERLKTRLLLDGYSPDDSDKKAKEMYDYIMKWNPMGAYITGDHANKWDEDHIVLPNLDKDECYKIIDKLIDLWRSRNPKAVELEEYLND